ncbi:MAG: head-tail adaptor protein [Christensenella sp.]
MKLKDKKIEILGETYIINENGYPETILQAVCPPAWAYFRQLSGKEIFAESAVNSVEEALFIINWRADITPAHVIRYNDALWDIKRVDTFEGYKADLTVYAKRRIRQS